MFRYLSSLRGILILVLAVAVAVAGSQLVVSPMPAAADSPGDACRAVHQDDPDPGIKTQCIAEMPMRTRGRLATNCFSDRELQKNAIYQIGECIGGNNIQAEAVAQARAITRFNASGLFGKPEASGQITPNVQWEVTIPSGRVDILAYDRFAPGTPVELVEAKLNKGGSGAREANGQLSDYQRRFPVNPTNRPIDRYDLSQYKDPESPDRGYTDSFNIQIRKCDLTNSWEVYNHYEVGSVAGMLGVLLVSDPHKEVFPCDSPVRPVPTGGDDDGQANQSKGKIWKEEHPDAPSVLQQIETELIDALIEAGLEAALDAAVTACMASGTCEALATAIIAGAALGILVDAVLGWLAGLFGWHIFGDPHIATLDGLSYDLQSVGEFHLLQVPDSDIDIQARFSAVNANVSQFSSLAFEINGVWVELSGSTLKINGAPVSLAAHDFYDLGAGAGIMRGGRGNAFYSVVFSGNDTDQLMLMWNGSNVGFHVPQGMRTTGLLGNHNGNPLDDLALSDGTPLPANSSPTVLHGRYADSWRITDDDSAFAYADGQSTATFTDRSFPANVVTIGDFSEAEIAVATQTCQDAGVLPGPQFEDCVFDVVSTGDESYAESAAGVTTALVDPADHVFDDAGDLAEDFEGTVGSNFAAPHYLQDTTTTRMAGPLFDTPGYAIRARTVGRHQSLRLRADLYAYGNIGDDNVAQSLALTLDGVAVGQVNFEGTEGPTLSGGLTGTIERTAVNSTEAGTPYSKYALDVTLPHAASSVDVVFTPKYFRGVLGTSLGIDNIDMTLAVPAADTFDVTLPLTTPSAQATAAQGAGVIEVAGAQDDYRFSLAAPSTLALQTRSCSVDVTATLVNTGTGERTPLATSCGNTLSPAMPAGSYRLEIFARSAASYAFDLYVKPSAQSFALGVLGSSVSISDGVPGAGAGNLETSLSRDDYPFSLPGPATMALDFGGSAYSPRWTLTKPDGSSSSGTGNARLEGLVAGDYQLRVGSLDSFGSSGGYHLVLATAAAQSFALGSLATPLPVVADGVPAAGAGRLESKAAEDDYTLTVPAAGSVELDWSCAGTSGYVSWSLLRADGSTVASNYYCTSQVVQNVPAGDYRLVVKPQYEYTGTYSLVAGMVPAAQVFDLGSLSSAAVTISDGVPAAGAGRLETRTSQDEYRFTLPSTQSVFADFTGSSFSPLAKLLKTDGTLVSQFRGNTRLQDLPAGDYRLVLGNPTSPETAGTYQLVLTAATAQSFALGSLATPSLVVSDGVPGAGAGRLESKAAEDDYTLTVPAAGSIELDWSCAGTNGYVNWSLLRADGSTVASNYYCTSQVVQNVPAGDYRLVVKPQYEYIGTYSLVAGMVPAAQSFDLGTLSAPVTISDGVPAAGAGRLETRTSQDEYRFTLSSTQSVFADFTGSSFSPLAKLLKADGTLVMQFRGNTRLQDLPAGDYRLVLGNPTSPETIGTYSLILSSANGQLFDLGSLGTPVQLVADGVPGAGAGRLESKAAEDDYTLTVPVAGSVELDWSCAGTNGYVSWTLVRADGSTVASNYYCTSQVVQNAAAGDYRLVVKPQYEYIGTYSLVAGMVPAAQSFDLGTLSTAVTISDGVPAAGAGKLETRTSQDEYRFTLPSVQSVFADFAGSSFSPLAKLLKTDGTLVTQFRGNTRLQDLPTGDYRLVLGNPTSPETAGTYALVLTVAATQNFALGTLDTPVQLISDQVPGSGAGRLESKAAEDDYTLTVPAAGSVELDWSCAGTSGYVNWSLVRADGSTVASNYYCTSQAVANVAAGDYRLVVKPQYEYIGTYSVVAGMVPAAQVFDLGSLSSATVTIADGVPADGAGRLETRTSQDEYRFSLDSTQSVFADFAGSSFSPLAKLLKTDGTLVSQFRGNTRLQDLPVGDYRLVLGNPTSPETAGTYKLVLTAASTQAFALGALGTPVQLVADGVPGAGAGRLESKAAEDDYTLTVPMAGSIELDWSCAGTNGYVSWSLLRGDGSTVASNYYCTSQVVANVAAGDYRLVVKPQYEYTGTYSLVAGMVPAAQVFSLGTLSTSVTIADGVPAAGAGRLETRTSQDEYRFTLSSVQSVFADFAGSSFSPLAKLLKIDGTLVSQFRGNTRLQDLAAGDYRLVLGNPTSPETAGPYFLILSTNNAQFFSLGSLGTPAPVVSDGVPGPGAGRLESKAAEDDYTLTVPATGSVELDWSCAGTNGYVNWSLLRADGSTVASNYYCTSQVVQNVPAGDYRLVVKPQYEYTGTYSLIAGMVPAAQSFDLGTLSAPVTISDGVPAAGAGKLETRTSQDEYRFTLSSVQSVFADFTGSSFSPLAKLLKADGTLVSQFRGNTRLQDLPAGDYRLALGNPTSPETAGTYKLVLTAAAAQAFALGALSTPASLVSDGVPAVGAGRLESKAAEDDYTLTVPAAGSVELDWSCGGTNGYVSWSLLRADGSTVASNYYCTSQVVQNVAAGDYRLVVKPQYEYTGTYSLVAGMVPAVQSFDLGALTGPVTIGDGVPAAGAGRLETRTSQDEYRFTLPSLQSVFADFTGSSFSPLAKLLKADGTLVSQFRGNTRLQDLPAGDYRLVLGNPTSPETAGTYKLVLTAAAKQVFALGTLSTPASVVADGVPAAGAGGLESKAAEDDYTLTVPAAGSIELDWSCAGTNGYVNWSLLRADGVTVASNYYCTSQVVQNVAAGNYQLVVKPQYEYTGTYSLVAGMVPAAQVFDLGSLSSAAVTISDGVPTAGAGRLETRTSQDEYRFTLPSAQSVFADFTGSSFSPLAKLLKTDGTLVSQFRGNTRLQDLPAGDYRLVLGNPTSPETAGTYTVTLTAAAKQVFALGTLSTPASAVADGVPAAGAGGLESKAAEDDYTLTVPAAGSIELDWSCAGTNGYVNWSLLRADGSTVASNYYCTSQVVQNVAAGDYRLVAKPQYEYIGTYSLVAGMVPAVQSFDLGTLSTAVTISDGVPAAGAGRLETRTSQDEYRFTLPSVQSVFADFAGSSFSPLAKLLKIDGTLVSQFRGNTRLQDLPAGDYRLVLGNPTSPETAGAYTVTVTAAAKQVFALGTLSSPAALVSDGVPASGAGRLESKAAEDDYTLTAPAGSIKLTWSCAGTNGYVSWSLLRADGSTVASNYYCTSQVVANVPAGDYRLVVKPQYEYTGTYSLTVGMA